MDVKRMLSKATGIIVLSCLLAATIGTGQAMARKRTLGRNGGGGGYAAGPFKSVVVSASFVDFGPVNVGNTTAPVNLMLTSTGTDDVTLTAAPTLSGANPGEYVISAGTCTQGTVLAPGQSCTAQVQFSPNATGALDALADFPTDSVDPLLQVAQLGTGI